MVDKIEIAPFVEAYLRNTYPGRSRPYTSLLGMSGGKGTYVIETDSTLALLGPKTTQRPEPFLSLLCALATGVPESLELYKFVNEINYNAWFGTTNVQLRGDGLATVLSALLVPMEPITLSRPESITWVTIMLNTVLNTAEQKAPELVTKFGGERFPPQHVEGLFLMS
jgi:hypothetical protein